MADTTTSLEGHFLISMPSLDEGVFARSVIYLCAHSREGAMGLIINKPADNVSFTELLEKLNISPGGDEMIFSSQAETMSVLTGGPVEAERGFVLHTADFSTSDSTIMIEENIALTATLDILRAIAAGTGPERALFLLGYAGWAPGQLESELQANSWLSVRANSEILFSTEFERRYEAALRALGIHPALLSSQVGHG